MDDCVNIAYGVNGLLFRAHSQITRTNMSRFFYSFIRCALVNRFLHIYNPETRSTIVIYMFNIYFWCCCCYCWWLFFFRRASTICTFYFSHSIPFIVICNSLFLVCIGLLYYFTSIAAFKFFFVCHVHSFRHCIPCTVSLALSKLF